MDELGAPPSEPGYEKQWLEVYEKTHKVLLGYGYKLTGNYADAQDLAQDTLLALGKRLKNATPDAPLDAPIVCYAVTVARNIYWRQFKNKNNQTTSIQENADDSLAGDFSEDGSFEISAALEQYNKNMAQGRAETKKNYQREIMEQALKMLPKNKRDLLLCWAKFDEETVDGCQELADRMELDRRVVSYEVSRAKAMLRYRAKVLMQKK